MAVLHVFWIVAGLFLLAGNLEARPHGKSEAQTVKLDQSELQRLPKQIRAIPHAQLGDFLQNIPNRQFGSIVKDLTSGQLTHVIKSIPDEIVGSIAQDIPDDELKQLFINLNLPTIFLKPAKNLPKDKLGGIVKAFPNIGEEIRKISKSELGFLAKKIPSAEIGKIAEGISSDDIRDIIEELSNDELTSFLQYLPPNFFNKPAVTVQSQNQHQPDQHQSDQHYSNEYSSSEYYSSEYYSSEYYSDDYSSSEYYSDEYSSSEYYSGEYYSDEYSSSEYYSDTKSVLLSDTDTSGGDAVRAVLGKVGLIDGLKLGLQGIIGKLPILGSPSKSDGPLGLIGVLKGVKALQEGLFQAL